MYKRDQIAVRTLENGFEVYIQPKQYSAVISITKEMLEDNKVKALSKKMKQCEKCAIHIIDFNLSGRPYRLYKRGKNRCLKCGVKI